MILHGKDLIVSIDGNANMASKSCTLSVSAKSIVKTSPTSGDWEEVLSGKKSWSLTTNHLEKEATAQTVELSDPVTNFFFSNSRENGWAARGNTEGYYPSLDFDEIGVTEGIYLLEIPLGRAAIRKTTKFDKNATYDNVPLKSYMQGESTIEGSYIDEECMIVIMTVGEFVLDIDTCAIISGKYHVALPCIQFGNTPVRGEKTYDTTPVIIVGYTTFSYGYAQLNSISNELNFSLYDGIQVPKMDGIPGAIEMVGKTVAVRMKDEHGSEWVGQGIVKQFKVTGTKGNLMAGSFAFTGNGELQTAKKLYDVTPVMPPKKVDRIVIDMNKSNSTEMITGDIDGKILNYILNHFHRYLCKYQGNGTMAMCQLDDTNSYLFAKGGSATTLDGTTGDVYVGYESWSSSGMYVGFYYGVQDLGDNKYMISVSYQSFGGSSYWSNKNLIGAFKTQATTSYNNTEAGVAGGDYYLRSIYKDAVAFADTPANLLGRFGTTQGKMNPAYFGLVGSEEHTIIALLYLLLKGNTNSRAIMGTGHSGLLKTGITSSIGMRNTKSGEGSYVNIFGLENWWGGGPEVMERMMIDNNGLTTITPRTGDPITIQGPATSHSAESVIKTMAIGDLYMAPTEDIYPYKNEYFCDEYLRRSGEGYVQRAAYGGGIFSLSTIGAGGIPTSPSRICFRGNNVQIIDNPQAFLALTAVDPAN